MKVLVTGVKGQLGFDVVNELKEKNIKFFLDLEIHEYRIDDKISYDKEFLIQDPDGYLLRFNN